MMCGKPIYLTLFENYFNKGDVINTPTSTLKIVKTYKSTWWRKLLRKIGFNIKSENVIRCKLI